MMRSKISTFLWFWVGIMFSLLAVLVVLGGFSGKVYITDPDGIAKSADTVLHCIRIGDWKTLDLMVYGSSGLSPETGEAGSAEEIIWNAYRQSLQWTCSETFSIQDSYVTQQVAVSCLDIGEVTNRITAILAEPTNNTADTIDHSQILRDTAQLVLEKDPPVTQHEITLTFFRENGRWQLISNNALLALLSGFTTP